MKELNFETTTGVAISNSLTGMTVFNREPIEVEANQRDTLKPFIIGVAGGTASGKTTVCNKIIDELQCQRVDIISMDSFYRPLTPSQRANVANYNFDHPDAFDWELLEQTVKAISQGFVVRIPEYDFVTHSRTENVTVFYPGDIVMIEGILIFHDRPLMQYFDLKVFVSTDADIRVCRRLQRDIVERGRSVDNVLMQYQKTVKPSHDLFCQPTQQYADIIVPHGGQNIAAIKLLSTHIRSQLHFRGRLEMKKPRLFHQPTNFEEDLPKITLPILKRLCEEDNKVETKKLLVDPFMSMASRALKNAIARKQEISVISLLQNPSLAQLCAEFGIKRIHDLSSHIDLVHHKISSSAEDILQDVQNTHVFVFDAFTFTGNRVRATLIWLLEHTPIQNVTCINMICSERSLNLLAHSFTNVQFFTLSQLEEINNIWDLPEEGKFVRSIWNEA